MLDLLMTNIGVLATPRGSTPKRGADQGVVDLLENAYIGIADGRIACIGSGTPPEARETIDARGALVTPGLVDAHTHAVFGGWRQHELELKLAGMGYLDILKAGGGILSTVRQTRAATEDELYEKTAGFLRQMLRHGTTTCEIKSGYGLNLADELKQLRVVRRLGDDAALPDVAATFMGAHAVPDEYKADRAAYIRLLIDEIIPAAAAHAEFCDAFCETGVFSADESREILSAAKAHGLKLKLHADEIEPIGGAELAAELGAVSAEHLIQASDAGIAALAAHDVIAVLLPATSLYLDKPFARARTMLDHGLAVAVATDFNPGSSPNLNLQLPMTLACVKYKLTPKEALTAVTLNAACAISRGELLGTLEEGKQADIVIWDCPDLNFLFYRYGSNQVRTVIKKGTVVCKS